MGARVCLFLGPSASVEEVRAAFAGVDADLLVLPPCQQGDILRLSEELPDVIGVVDGFFFHTPALLHREILLALERGARVLGAASLGALRAAELDTFGMEGVGAIYRLYRRGAIDGDDEVAVLHAPANDGFRPLTEALVAIRHNVRRARRRGVISAATAAAVIERARRLHFGRRTYEAVLDAGGPDVGADREIEALRRFLRDEAVDLKRADALALARTIVRRLRGREAWPALPPVRLNRTAHFWWHAREYVGRWVGGQFVPDDLVVSVQGLRAPRMPRWFRRVALRCLAVDEAEHRGLERPDADALVTGWRRARGLVTEEAYRAWLRRSCLTDAGLREALGERALEERLLALYRGLHPDARGGAALRRRIVRDVAARTGLPERRLPEHLLMRPGVPWSEPLIRELKLRGGFRPALGRAAEILATSAEFFRHDPSGGRSPLWYEPVNAFFAARWGVDRAGLEAAIAARGFVHYGLFFDAARHVYAHEQVRRRESGGGRDAPGGLLRGPIGAGLIRARLPTER